VARRGTASPSTVAGNDSGETYSTSLAGFLGQLDTFRRADTTMRSLTQEEFRRGQERLRRAVPHADATGSPETRSNRLDLLVLR
jgi:hypothetical protein